MLALLRNLFSNHERADLGEIESLPVLTDLDKFLLDHHDSIAGEASSNGLTVYKDYSSDGDTPDALKYLENLFDAVNHLLKSSNDNDKFVEDWRISLHELLVKVPYNGEYLERAQTIKQDILANKEIALCSEKTKNLLLKYVDSTYKDQQDTCAFLQEISLKLSSIYGEMNEASNDFSQGVINKRKLTNSFESGIQEIKQSINSTDDIVELKKGLGTLVNSLQSKISAGFEADINDSQILQSKIVALNSKVESLETHTKDLECKIRQKHEEAITDPLTGLYNRAGYIQELESAWLDWQQEKVPSALLVWDIDHFKALNDQYGHAAGDKVLQSVSHKLKSSLRGDDIVARFGGEEFTMLLKNKGVAEGKILAEKIRSIIEDTEFTYKNQPLHVTISCGIAVFIEDDTPTTLFERADKALYKAKRTGRNKVEALSRKVA